MNSSGTLGAELTTVMEAGAEPRADRAVPAIIVRRRWAIPLAIAFLGFVLNTIVAVKMSATYDEASHVQYGAAILKGSTERSSFTFDSKMPISALNALPRAISEVLRARGVAVGFADKLGGLLATRFPTIFGAFGLSLLVYLYAESLYGRVAGLFAQFLFVISPNIIAHSTLATTDLYIALTTILFLYCFRRFLLRSSFANALFAAATLALAQLTKFVATFLYPAVLLFVISLALYSKYGHDKRYRLTLRQIGLLLVLHLVCFVAILNVGFVFDRTFTPLSKYQFRSVTFKSLQQVPFLRAVPLPLPSAYFEGMDWMTYDNGLAPVNMVLLGDVRGPELARSDGFPSYYLAAYGLKEPLGMQLLLLLGLWWTARHRRLADFLVGEWLLLVTAGVILLMLSLFSRSQIGIRHILPVLAIFVILSGGAFADVLTSSWRQRVLLAACLLWTVVSVASYFPHMIPYFNELLTDRRAAYRFLADSNLDWNQDKQEVQDFLRSNPDVVLNPPQPVTGRILVSANFMAGVIPRKADYWVRRNGLKPVAQVGYAHLLFVIPADK